METWKYPLLCEDAGKIHPATLRNAVGKWNNIPRFLDVKWKTVVSTSHSPTLSNKMSGNLPGLPSILNPSPPKDATTAIPTPNSRVDKTCRTFLAQVVASLWDPTQRTQQCWKGLDVESAPFFYVWFQASSPDLCLNLVCLTQLNMILSILNANVIAFWQVFGAASSHSRDLHSSYSCYDFLKNLPILSRGKFRQIQEDPSS